MSNNAKRLILVVSASALAGAAFAQGKLTGVQWKKVGDGLEIQILGSDLEKPKSSWTSGNRLFVLEFDAKLDGKAKTQHVDWAGLNFVKYGWFKARPPKVRVSFNVDAGAKPELNSFEGGWTVSFGDTKTVKAPKEFAYPDKVPPLDKPFLQQTIEKMAASPVHALPPIVKPPLERTVSLEFVGTDVVQILKALSLQANVNIVTAPDVAGKLTVGLNGVSVQQALDFVTTLAGLRYALVDNTFVVSTSANFSNAMRQLNGNQDVSSQTRIISLESGEGAQIKAAVLKAVPQDSILGRYDLILPTESLTLETKSMEVQANASGGKTDGNNGNGGATSASGAGEANKTDITSKTETGNPNAVKAKDLYVMLVGLPKRLDEVERAVREVDSNIARANRIMMGKDLDMTVVPIYSGHVAEVSSAMRKIIDRDPKRDYFSIQESTTGSPAASDSIKLLLLSGPTESIKNLEAFAKGIDAGLCKSMGVEYPETDQDQERAFEVLDLMFVEPIEAASELQKQVPGLRVSLLPGPVRPNVRGTKSVALGNAESGSSSTETNQEPASLQLGSKGGSGQSNSSGGSSSSAGNSSAGSSSSGSSSSNHEDGSSLTRSLGSEPMKLMVRGNRSQISQARQFLSLYDVAPKQVSLELRVMEISKDDALKVGLDWSALTGGAVQMIRVNQGINSSQSIPGTVGADIRFNGESTGSVTATLDRLAGSFKMVARPNILASEGRPTNIFVGDEVRYVESIVSSSTNGPTITTGQVNVGVKLNVTPRVGANGNITLDLNPEMSILKGFTDVVGGGQLPQTSLRSTTSMVTLKSGETLAIGGLIQESDRKTVSGIPLLMDLPVIGHLFKRTSNTSARSEVVFFLTVTEVREGNRANAADPRNSEKTHKPELNAGGK